MDYDEWVAALAVLFVGIIIGAFGAGIIINFQHDGELAKLEAEQRALMQEVELLKVEEIYILKYALKQYHEELKDYYENFDKGGQSEK